MGWRTRVAPRRCPSCQGDLIAAAALAGAYRCPQCRLLLFQESEEPEPAQKDGAQIRAAIVVRGELYHRCTSFVLGTITVREHCTVQWSENGVRNRACIVSIEERQCEQCIAELHNLVGALISEGHLSIEYRRASM